MGVSSRFLDPQYINWLRCASSLVILKESLHDYTEAGVRRLYDNVKHNVTTRLGSHFQCSDCSWRGIRQQHPTGAWVIKCNNNICNIWLGEILSKHDDPHCKTIDWGNADITKWSTDPWEIAKVYMTNGQRNKTNLPQELDSPALLSLLKYCKEFHPISVQLVSDIIEIRNRSLHSPDLRVSDQDKDTWIDRMLSLVSSMNIQGVTYTNIDKVRTEDIYITFQDQEIKVLQSMVSEVLNEVTALKGDIDCLMNAQSQHLEEIEKVKEAARDNEAEIIGLQTQTQQLETDLKGQKSQLESYVQVISTLRTFLDNNSDLSNIKISVELRATSDVIKAMQSQLQTVELQLENVKREVLFIKFGQEKLRMDQEAIKTEMTLVKGEQEKIMAEHQVVKGEMTAVKGEQEKLRVEHLAVKGEMTAVKGEQEKIIIEHQALKGEMTAVKGEQEKIIIEHQALKGEMTAVKGEQEKIRVEHEVVKLEMTAVKSEQEILRNQIEQIYTHNKEYLEQDETEKQAGSSNMRNPVKGSDPDVQELFDKFNSILKFIASKSGGVEAKDVSKKCDLGVSKKVANPLLYFLKDKQSLDCEQVRGSQKKIWKLGVKRPSDQELREYAVEKLAQGRRQ